MKSISVILAVFLSVFGVINAYPLGFAGLGYPLGGHSYSVSHSLPHAGYGLGVGLPYGGSSYSVSHAVPHAGYGLGLGYGYGYGLGAGVPHIGSSVHSVSHSAPHLGLGLGYGYGYGLGHGLGHVSTSVHSAPQVGLGLGYGLGYGLGLGWPHASTTTHSVNHGPHFGLPAYSFGTGLGASINSAVQTLSPGYLGYTQSTYPGYYSTGAKVPSGSVLGSLIAKDTTSTQSDNKATDSTSDSNASDVSIDSNSVSASNDKVNSVDSSSAGGNLRFGSSYGTGYGTGYGYPSFNLYKKK